MKGRVLIVALAPALILWLAVTVASAGVNADVVAEPMTGAKEVPGPGDPNGSGSAAINLKPRKGEMCWQLLWSNVSGVTGAHIHKGGAAVSGPIKVTFFEAGPPGNLGDGASGCTDAWKRLQRRIKNAPTNYYVNFHTTEFSSGAIRDQLRPGHG